MQRPVRDTPVMYDVQKSKVVEHTITDYHALSLTNREGMAGQAGQLGRLMLRRMLNNPAAVAVMVCLCLEHVQPH